MLCGLNFTPYHPHICFSVGWIVCVADSLLDLGIVPKSQVKSSLLVKANKIALRNDQ